MSQTTATGFEKFVIDSYVETYQEDTTAYQYNDSVLNESFCGVVNFPFDHNKLFDVRIDLEALNIKIWGDDSEEYFLVDIIGMNFQTY